jgi:glutamyl/glutaminyl-tRNA synthetase
MLLRLINSGNAYYAFDTAKLDETKIRRRTRKIYIIQEEDTASFLQMKLLKRIVANIMSSVLKLRWMKRIYMTLFVVM